MQNILLYCNSWHEIAADRWVTLALHAIRGAKVPVCGSSTYVCHKYRSQIDWLHRTCLVSKFEWWNTSRTMIMFYQSHFPWSANQKLSLVHHHKTLNPAGFHSLYHYFALVWLRNCEWSWCLYEWTMNTISRTCSQKRSQTFSGQKLLETYYTKVGRHSKNPQTPCKAERQSLEQGARAADAISNL